VFKYVTGFDKTRRRATFGDMAISFLVDYAEELKIAANTRLFLSCVGEYIFQTPEIQAVLNSSFRDGNDIAGGGNRDGGWGGLNIEYKMEYEVQPSKHQCKRAITILWRQSATRGLHRV